MKILKTFNLNRIRNKEWYHQRFDGCPMFINFIAEAEIRKEKRKLKGTEADIRVCFYEDGKADWHLDMKDVDRGAQAIIKLATKDPHTSKKLLALWKKDEGLFDKFFIEFRKLDLKKLSDPELNKLWNGYYTLSINRLTSSSIIDHFALGTDKIIRDVLRAELKNKYKTETEFTNLFSISTAPTHQSFINLAEIELLKIITGKSKETLEQYQKRYFWTRNNYYSAHILSVKHFQDEVKHWKTGKKNLAAEFKKLQDTPIRNRKEKAKLYKKFKLSSLLKNLIKISEDFTWWQDERKRATYLNIHIGCELLKEIGPRFGYTLEELKYATAAEIETIVKSKIPSRNELQIRMKGCAFIAEKKGYYITTGKAVGQIKKIVLGDADHSAITEFRGLSASTGKATGTVKVVKSATEIAKVKKGDILVAVMTRPDYIMGMKVASAIVTNEGGITSHAAIVSRELGIPCIIGTKIATEVLKDGDIAEVDANNGIIRKIG